MNANLERLVNRIHDDVKHDFPGLSTFRLKTAILDQIRKQANEQADLMIETAQFAQIVQDLAALVRSQP